jgi:DNA-binding winged helix-turn-helix (wHTH) protein/tetratricopeptide (TPR) repeat protein
MLKTPPIPVPSKTVPQPPSGRLARFGTFEVDFRERKLTKGGIRIRLQEQPFRILALLLEHPGELVTREQIRLQVWPQDLFVDFDAALNTAVGKLRAALSDSADNPRFLETVPRRGYRFVAPVGWSPSLEAPIPPRPEVRKRPYLWYATAVMILAIAAIAGFWRFHRPAPKITSDDTIVLADFVNTTGDPTFDDALKTALRVSLQQSPFFKVLSDSAITRTLRQMTRPGNTPLTGEVARELCQRAGSKAYLAGSIGTLGSQYVLGLKAVNCQTGDTLAEEQAFATSKEKVLNALGQSASKLRSELGESLASVQKFDVPLALATTSSLEALKLYSLGIKAFDEKGPPDALPYLQRVVQIDPNFAAAYRLLGLVYAGLAQTDRANEYFTKAFHLQDRVSEWERLAITADYYMNVTGELDKAAETYKRWSELYSRNNGSVSTLGIVYALQGQYEKAIETTKRALSVGPSYGSYANLVSYNLALQHFDEAQRVLDQAQGKKMDGLQIRATLYALAFLRSDSAAMAEQQKWFTGRPEENYGLSLAGDTEAYRGHLNVSRELTARAAASATRADNKESGAIWLANAAIREAAFGNAPEARRTAAQALKLAPTSQGIEAEAALAFAMTGDQSRAESLAQNLNKRFPLDTQMQSLWLPAIRTQLAISAKNSDYILTDPQNVSPVEYGGMLFTINPTCLYPVYIRGNAYLAAGRGKEAAIEFQKILDHSGVVWNCWTGALAHLGVARANALQATTLQGTDADAVRAHARSAYNDFFTLWKDADTDIPILKQAKAEYAKLH